MTNLDAGKAREIRRLRREGWTLRRIAECFGVSRTNAGYIVSRQTRAHVE